MRRGGYLQRLTPLERGKRLRRRGRRRDETWAKQYHSVAFVCFTHAQPCAACGSSPSECAHLTPRSRCGTWRDICPLCASCHVRQEKRTEAFIAETGVDLWAAAAAHVARWETR